VTYDSRADLERGHVEDAIREASRRGGIRELLDEAWRLGRVDLMRGIVQCELLGRPRHIMGHLIALADDDIDRAHDHLRSLWPRFNAPSEERIRDTFNPTAPTFAFRHIHWSAGPARDRMNPNSPEHNLCPLCLGQTHRGNAKRGEGGDWEVRVSCRSCKLAGVLYEGDLPSTFNAPKRLLEARRASYRAGWCFFCLQLPLRLLPDKENGALTCHSCQNSLSPRIWAEALGHNAKVWIDNRKRQFDWEQFELRQLNLIEQQRT
jgi:hypothetical protein